MSATGKRLRAAPPIVEDYRAAGHFGIMGTPAIALTPAQRKEVFAVLAHQTKVRPAAVDALVGDIERLLFDAKEARRILPEGHSVREVAERLADRIDQLRMTMAGLPDAAWMRIRAEHTGLRYQALPEKSPPLNEVLTMIDAELDRLSVSARLAARELQGSRGRRPADLRRDWLRERLADAFRRHLPRLSVKLNDNESPFWRVFVVVQGLDKKV